MLRATLLLLLALLVGGCTSYAPPTLAVTRAYVAEESDAGVAIAFNLDATNTNSIELPLKEVRYTLSINGEPVFYGVRSPEAALRRLGTQPITFPAVIRIDEANPRPTGTARYDIDGTLTYLTPGQLAEVLFDLKFRRPKVAFHQSGTIDFGAAPPPAPPALTRAP